MFFRLTYKRADGQTACIGEFESLYEARQVQDLENRARMHSKNHQDEYVEIEYCDGDIRAEGIYGTHDGNI